MSVREGRSDLDDQGRWWKLDFTTILMLLIVVALVLIITSEIWHTHFAGH